jgi:uncharacterized protein (DUF58 family)
MLLNSLIHSKRAAAFKRLELIARSVVEGLKTGLHKSPYKGFAVEFQQHRPYVVGDDLKHLDWKVLAKDDRYYIKEFEEDTCLRAYLIVDASGSMGYRSKDLSKFELARQVGAVLSYLMLQQQDSVGMITFDSKIREHITPRSTNNHMKHLIDTLAATKTRGETDLGSVLQTVAQKVGRRSLIIILSDLFGDLESIEKALRHFAHKKHEVVVFQTLDPYEKDFPFTNLTRFESMEEDHAELVDPLRLKKAYLEKFHQHQTQLKKACHSLKIDYEVLLSHEPIEKKLAEYLVRRMRR